MIMKQLNQNERGGKVGNYDTTGNFQEKSLLAREAQIL